MEQLLIAPTKTYARELLSPRIAEQAPTDRPLEILEAGCGREWNIDIDGVDVRMTGIDLDEEALAYRRDVVGDLDEAIHGDLRAVGLRRDFYDVVYSASCSSTSTGPSPFSTRWSTRSDEEASSL